MDDNDPDQVRRLLVHIAALETELASYAHRYGLTDAARELLKDSPARKDRPLQSMPAGKSRRH